VDEGKRERTGLEGISGEADRPHGLLIDEVLVKAVAAKEGVGVSATPVQETPELVHCPTTTVVITSTHTILTILLQHTAFLNKKTNLVTNGLIDYEFSGVVLLTYVPLQGCVEGPI